MCGSEEVAARAVALREGRAKKKIAALEQREEELRQQVVHPCLSRSRFISLSLSLSLSLVRSLTHYSSHSLSFCRCCLRRQRLTKSKSSSRRMRTKWRSGRSSICQMSTCSSWGRFCLTQVLAYADVCGRMLTYADVCVCSCNSCRRNGGDPPGFECGGARRLSTGIALLLAHVSMRHHTSAYVITRIYIYLPRVAPTPSKASSKASSKDDV